MALLTVGYSSVASADTGTVTKEEGNSSKIRLKRRRENKHAQEKVTWLKRGSDKGNQRVRKRKRESHKNS